MVMACLEDHYSTRLQGIRRQGGTVQVYANIPLPLASALDLEPGETVTWKVVDRTHLLLVRLPERKPLQGVARPSGEKKTRRGQESHS
jgi:antitoxin component of MazEF toxin-antitoxin module